MMGWRRPGVAATWLVGIALVTLSCNGCHLFQSGPQDGRSESTAPGSSVQRPDAARCVGPFRRFDFGSVVETGLITCFEAGLTYEQGGAVSCETSAALCDGTEVILASDQNVPGTHRSPVFSTDLDRRASLPHYLTAAPFQQATKYEDAALTLDCAYAFLTTGFDRVKPNSNEWDAFNTMLFWPLDAPDQVAVVSPTQHDGVVSSVGLRSRFSKVLCTEAFPDGVPYFKIEGLAIIPGARMLLGVRELGLDYRTFEYAFKILCVSYRLHDGSCDLVDDVALVYDYQRDAGDGLPAELGLSSLEYDPSRDRLYVLTTFEASHQGQARVCGYLWHLSLADLFARIPPSLVHDAQGHPLKLNHKCEGLTLLDSDTLFIINDDDRIVGDPRAPSADGRRLPHQTSYAIVKMSQ